MSTSRPSFASPFPLPALLVCATLSGVCAPTLAQDPTTSNAADDSETRLEPITVTGSRPIVGQTRSAIGFDLSDRDVPQSTSVIGQDEMDAFGLRNANDVLSHATGVTVERFETDRTSYTARGFDITNFQFDGIGMPFRHGTQFGDLDTAVFTQVDVVRGANGLLSATGNPSATVNFVRKRPTATRQASAELTLGSWQGRRAEVDLAGPLTASGAVRGRVIAVGDHADSYLDRYSVRKTVLAGLLDVDLAPGTGLSVGWLEQKNRALNPMWGALPLVYSDGTRTDYRVSASTAPDWTHWNNDDRRAHAELTHDLGGEWTVQASALYRTLGQDSELFYVYNPPRRPDGAGMTGDPGRTVGVARQTSADLRLSGPFTLGGRRHEALVGLNGARETARAHSDNGDSIDLPPVDLSTWDGRVPRPTYDPANANGTRVRNDRIGLFGATHLHPTERLSVILGANLARARSSGISYGADIAYRHSTVTPYAGLVYRLSDAVSVYASQSRIFQPQHEVDVDNRVLAPIRGSNLEAGAKAEWLDRRLSGSFAVFRARQENAPDAAGTFPDSRPYYRGVDATSTGFEAELAGRPAPGWDIDAGYAHMQIRDHLGAPARTYLPRDTLNVSSHYRLSTAPAWVVGANLRWQAATHRVSQTFPVEQAAYALIDLMASHEFNRHLKLTLNVDNVGDRKHLNSLYWDWTYYGAPRKVSATLRWSL